MSGREITLLLRILVAQAKEAHRDARRMGKRGLSGAYDRGVRDGFLVSARTLIKRWRA